MWRKFGCIYSLPKKGLHEKLCTHAANPLAIHLESDIFRVYYSARDFRNRSSVGAADIDLVKKKVVYEHKTPFFEFGPCGTYYSDGISIGNCYKTENRKFILFMGWQNPPNAHWHGNIGRITVDLNGQLHLDSDEPFITTDEIDPVSLSYPWVRFSSQDNYQMWYGSTQTWDAGNQEMVHVLNYATSKNGNDWKKHGLSVPYQLGKAQAFSRPSVAQRCDGNLSMWFSFRAGGGDNYKIGYAESEDGEQWTLQLAKSGISTSEKGWDSEMIEYPFVFDHKGQRYMLYNGNDYGRTGFGLARLEL